jgi:hypothetical protein
MAQAVSVPSSTRQLITGENPHQSTNLSAVGVQALHRHYFIGGSGAVIVSTGDVGLLRLSQDRRGDVKLENRRYRGSLIRDCRLFAGAAAAERFIPAPVPKQE